jgi:sorbose reductase
MAPAPTSRDELAARILPEMTLSDGSESSMTGPPAPMPHYITTDGRAQVRFSIEGNAIITGGGGTIGLAAARALLEHGLSGLMLFDINTEQLVTSTANLRAEFPEATITHANVNITDEQAVARAVERAAEALGTIDMLLCFAGVVGCTHAIDMTAAEFRRTLDINTTGSFLCAQAVAKQMIRQKTGGSIVFTASISGHRVNFPQPQIAYNVSKSALLTLKNCLAAEWAQYGIRVNSISPGYMDTILNEGPGLAAARATWASRNPMGRMGMPSELAGAIVLLCAAAGSYMNGCDIVVDGGQIVF